MAYFPNAFKQLFVTRINSFKDTGKTDELDMGEYGFFDPKTWTAIPLAQASVLQHPSAVLVLSNYHTVDKIGSHGGYKESVKSKPIDPRHVHRFYKVAGRQSMNQNIGLGFDGANVSSAPSFDKGKEYLLRLDLKGSPALRFFGRNLYHTFDASSGCLETCVNPCDPAAKIDPIVILLQWLKQIKEDPIFSLFVNPTVFRQEGSMLNPVNPDTYVEVTDPNAINDIRANLLLEVAYVDTQFGYCSFDPRDHYEMEPLQILASIVDENGDPCKIPYLKVTEMQPGRTAEGLGEGILRDMILFNRYRQEPFQLDQRRREIEDIEAVSVNAIVRGSVHDSYYLLYSVPRHSNPSGTQDADQYLIQFSVPKDTNMNIFENWLQAYLDSAGSGVKLEDLSSAP